LAGIPLDPSWPKELYVISDSVVLGAKVALPKALPDWKVTVDGRPALMIYKATKEMKQKGLKMPPVAVVALGSNSLWEKHHRTLHKGWKKFDDQDEEMLQTLKDLRAEKIVWFLVREISPAVIPEKGK